MKKTLAIVAACIMVAGALSLLQGNGQEKDTSIPRDDSAQVHTTYSTSRARLERTPTEAPVKPTLPKIPH